jgi:serine/threonine-protein kinase
MADSRSPAALPAGIPRPGELFAGKYRIEEVLGVGGMGAVLGARHVHLDERVAIKVILPAASDPSMSVRFLREARAAVKIKSEHVVKVLDFGQLESGQPYMVMEHLAGRDLAHELLLRGPLPVSAAVDYVLQACDAIAQAHALGIVHRDLKPSNLFLAEAGNGDRCVKVLDFGISKGVAGTGPLEALTLTKTQGFVGSPMYMAPEQMRPNHPIDLRTDVWALGVVAYELVTGRLPFEASSVTELCAMVLQDEPAPVERFRPDAPPGLGQMIARCLAKRPEGRYANLADLANALAPLGPPGATQAAQKIARALSVKLAEPAPGPSSEVAPRAGSHPVIAEARTLQAWTGSPGGAAGSARVKRLVAASASGVLILLAGVAAWVSAHGASSRTSAEAPGVSGSVAPAAQPAASPATAPEVAPPASAAAPMPPPTPIADPAATARAPTPSARPPRARTPPRMGAPPAPAPAPPTGSTGRTNSRYD